MLLEKRKVVYEGQATCVKGLNWRGHSRCCAFPTSFAISSPLYQRSPQNTELHRPTGFVGPKAVLAGVLDTSRGPHEDTAGFL
jgi:hypothetical protein